MARKKPPRELTAHELSRGMYVMLERSGYPPIRMRVSACYTGAREMVLYSAELGWSVTHRFNPKGECFTLEGATVHIFECPDDREVTRSK